MVMWTREWYLQVNVGESHITGKAVAKKTERPAAMACLHGALRQCHVIWTQGLGWGGGGGASAVDLIFWIWKVEHFGFCPTGHPSFPDRSVVKNVPANTGHVGSIPGSGKSPGGRHGNPLQYSCLGNPMDRGAWWATVHRGHKESDTTEAI